MNEIMPLRGMKGTDRGWLSEQEPSTSSLGTTRKDRKDRRLCTVLQTGNDGPWGSPSSEFTNVHRRIAPVKSNRLQKLTSSSPSCDPPIGLPRLSSASTYAV